MRSSLMKSAVKFGLFGAACATLLVLTPITQAVRMPPLPSGVRAALATVIVVGKVESIDEKTVAVKPFPDAREKVEYTIANVKVSDPILGAKGVTNVRVGFVASQGRYNLIFAKDQEGIFFLTPHADGTFMVAQTYNDFVNKQKNPNFDKDVEETKKSIKILENPKESLKADKQEDRFAAAAILVSKYRNLPRFNGKDAKTEAVDDEISKLILTALGEADWKHQVLGPGPFAMNALSIFQQLGVTEKDGYNPPTTEAKGPQGQTLKVVDYAKVPNYAKQWCKDNAGKYKIQRFVHDEKKEKTDK
jgi:hypothetical protein